MVRLRVVVSVRWPSSSITIARWYVGLARVIMLGLLLMVRRYGQRAMEVEMSLGLLFSLLVIMFAILDLGD